jgi:hypothetical protein
MAARLRAEALPKPTKQAVGRFRQREIAQRAGAHYGKLMAWACRDLQLP